MPHPSSAVLALDNLLAQPHPALGVFIPAGLHSLPAERRVLDALATHGTDLFEIGIPCDRPHLDGPVITAAFRRALSRGVTLTSVLRTVEYAARRAPVVVMSYWAPIQQHGPEFLARAFAAAGAAGIMVTDLPAEAAVAWHRTTARAGLASPRFVPRGTSDSQLSHLAARASGWLYTPASTAPTGYQGPLDIEALAASTQRLRSASPLPVVSGIGISTPRLASAVAPYVDAVLIGTPIVRALTDDLRNAPALAAEFAEALQPVGAFHH